MHKRKRSWWETLEERQAQLRKQTGKETYNVTCNEAKSKSKRQPYKWGAKNYLSSFEVGETRVYEEICSWRNLSSIACKMRRDFGCRYSLYTDNGQRMITRVL